MKVGDHVGHYVVIAQLGRGGGGHVWLAEHPAVRKRVAVKVIPASRSAGETARARFLAEARAVAALDHPRVVTLFDFGATDEGDLYYTMEQLEGRTLGWLLEERGPLPPARALRIAAQVADGLDAAHAAGVIHRDLKPSNVFLVGGATDDARLLDFGLAKRIDGSGLRTAEGELLGTPEYMAPEQCTARRDLDARVDVYGLGCLLHAMLTGRPPFTGDAADVLRAHVEQPPPKAGASANIDALLARLLAKDPGARPATMAAARDELLEVAGTPRNRFRGTPAPGATPIPGAPATVPRGVSRAPRRLWWRPTPSDFLSRPPALLSATIAALVVAIVGLAALHTTPSRRPAAPPGKPVALGVHALPEGAEVTIDSVARGPSPVVVHFAPGTTRAVVEVRMPGFAPWLQIVDPTRTPLVNVKLAPLPGTVSPTARPVPLTKAPPGRQTPPPRRPARLTDGEGLIPPQE